MEREEQRRRDQEEAEAVRLQRERERQKILDATGEADPDMIAAAAIPRAIPVVKRPGVTEPIPEEPVKRLDPMDVASKRAPDAPEREPERAASKIKASWLTRTDARSFTMLVPRTSRPDRRPRGQATGAEQGRQCPRRQIASPGRDA